MMYDVLPAQYGRGPVAGNLPSDIWVDTGPHHVAHGSASEIVKEFSADACFCTGSSPDLPKLSHLFTVSMKDIGTIQAAIRHAPRHNGE